MTRYTPQWLQSGSYAASQDRRLISALWPGPASSGCLINSTTGMTVNIAAGQVAVPSPNNTGSSLCTSDANEQVTLTAAPASGLNRIDLIICRPRGTDLDGGANNDFIFDFVTGVAAASPVVPATPAGTVALAQIAVAGGSAAVVAGNITDVRPGRLALGDVAPTSGPRGFVANVSGPPTQTDSTGASTIFATSVPVVAGRRYRITGFFNGIMTIAGAIRIATSPTDQAAWIIAANGLALNALVTATGVAVFTAAVSGPQTFSFVTSGAQTGTSRATANSCFMLIEDMGSS
jgi:hypothetical protein